MNNYNPTQVGAVLVFKQGVSKAEAEKALEKLKALLSSTPFVHPFDPEWGEPVWYIP